MVGALVDSPKQVSQTPLSSSTYLDPGAWRMAIRVSALAWLLASAMPSTASAHDPDPDLPDLDPKGYWRIMGHDDAASSSKCVGNPITPLCAIESIIACFEREDGELCRIGMGLDERPFFDDRQPKQKTYRYRRYRVVAFKRFQSGNLPPLRHLPPAVADNLPSWDTKERRAYQPGDGHVVVLAGDCWRDGATCSHLSEFNLYTYHVRQAGARWAVINWWAPEPRHRRLRRNVSCQFPFGRKRK
jgi:hypothetical protein